MTFRYRRPPRRFLFASLRTPGVVGVLLAVVSALVAGTGAAQSAADPQPAGPGSVTKPDTSAQPRAVWTILNSPGTWRRSPNASDNSATPIGNGQTVTLSCYYFGAAYGPYGNKLWYLAVNNQTGTTGWINDHNLNTPGTAANPQPQAGHCVTTSTLGPTYTATASPNVWSRSPSTADNSNVAVANGDPIQLGCYIYGAPTGPYNNPLWYIARDNRTGTSGWINDHNLTTPGTAANPSPQTFHC